MRFDPTKPILDLDNAPVKDGDKTLTIAAVCARALLIPARQIPGDESLTRFKLAQRIHDATGEIEITTEDGSLIKSAVGDSFTPLVYGRVYAAVEGEANAA